jgi:hypothetical protein
MSIELMALAFKHKMPDLEAENGKTVSGSAAKFVLIALADHANDEGKHVYPGTDLIHKKTGLSQRTVITCLSALRHNGFIIEKGTSARGTKEYNINVSLLHCALSSQPNVNPVHSECEPSSYKSSLTTKESSEENKIFVPVKRGRIHELTLIDEKELSDPQAGITYEPCTEWGEPVVKKKVTNHYPMAEAIAEVCIMDLEMNKGRLLKEAKVLDNNEELSPELVRQLYGKGGKWYTDYFIGKKGNPPRPDQIRLTYKQFAQAAVEIPQWKKDGWAYEGQEEEERLRAESANFAEKEEENESMAEQESTA